MKYKIAALFFSAVALLVSSAVLAAERPNIILILCDDLGYGDLACYGAPKIKTPALDKMAAEGMKFTDFHTGSPLCSPSRSAFLTGCYPRRIGLAKGVLRPDSDRGIHSSEKTMAELLKSCGYATACIGKWHLGFLPEFLPNRKGFDYYYGLWHNLDDWETKFYADQGGVPIMRNEEAVMRPARPEMMTELYTAEAVKFIEQNKSRPFFLYLAHTMPHLPLGISDRFRGKSNAGLYGDVIECLDWSVGTILETLRKNELRQKTLVIFTSDNGPEKNTDGSSGPLRGRKHTTYEGGLRVPLIAWGPGLIPTGKTCAELTCAMDLYPTFAQLAGAGRATNHVIDGCDILPLLRGQVGAVSPHKTFFYYGDGGQLEAVRSGRWKLFLKAQPELYDLAEDLGESKNLAAQNSNEVAQLRQLGRAFVDEMKLNARPAGQGVRAVVR